MVRLSFAHRHAAALLQLGVYCTAGIEELFTRGRRLRYRAFPLEVAGDAVWSEKWSESAHYDVTLRIAAADFFVGGSVASLTPLEVHRHCWGGNIVSSSTMFRLQEEALRLPNRSRGVGWRSEKPLQIGAF